MRDCQTELVSYDAIQFEPPALTFCHRTFQGQFLLFDQAWGSIGRNVLNLVPLVLDGPNLMWDETRPG
jgi:hypothetical protein